MRRTLLIGIRRTMSTMNKKSFDELMLRKMYLVPSFEIHNGPAGFFDLGPPTCTLKANILAKWRNHFVVEENMLEMECTNLTPSVVLETSGHVERFTDLMVRDEVTKECFRADKLLEEAIDKLIAANPAFSEEEKEVHLKVQRQAGSYSIDELHDMLNRYNVKSPSNKDNSLTKPFPFNLMFKTTIGPEGSMVGYLRPETAQGLFVNFRRLLDYNQHRMPFAAAQIGIGFRNEISPRNGLLRVREFCMAEIEHFVNPQDKSHSNFHAVKDVVLSLFSSANQLGNGKVECMSIGDAVSAKIVNNETLGYFMTRTFLFLRSVGVDPAKMRFRQHLPTEMAHYAADCWDMEILLSSGWTECVGHADRACYDLKQHSAKTGVPLQASIRLEQPIVVDKLSCLPNKKKIGPLFKTQQKAVIDALEALDGDDAVSFRDAMQAEKSATIPGTSFVVTAEMVEFKVESKTVVEEKYIPSVIEPSFGIGRILTAVLEHAFYSRDNDEQRCVMRFKPSVAPIKAGIFRLINNADFDPIVDKIRRELMRRQVVCKMDSTSGTVGRRYARADELGIPFGITVDFQTLSDGTVTLRERDSMVQIRAPVADVIETVCALTEESVEWSDVLQKFPVIAADPSEASEAADAVSQMTV